MTPTPRPNPLLMAGIVLTLVGGVIVLIRSLGLPGYWIPLGIGIALLAAGIVRLRVGGG